MPEAEIDNQVPATTEPHEEAPLAINADAVPDLAPAFTMAKITDALPAAIFDHIGRLPPLTAEQEAELDEPTPDEEFDILPDGAIYASHEFYRRKLNKVFGRGQWSVVPVTPFIARQDKSSSAMTEWHCNYFMFIGGIFYSNTGTSRKLYEDNRNMDFGDVTESMRSDAIRRCSKDLGIAHEAWNRRFQKRWREQYAVKVVVQTQRGNKEQWRRRDADALPGELQSRTQTNQRQENPPAGRTAEDTAKSHPISESGTSGGAPNGGQHGSPQTVHVGNAEASNVSKSTTSTQNQNPSTSPKSGAVSSPASSPNSQNVKSSVSSATAPKALANVPPNLNTEQSRPIGTTSANAQSAKAPTPQSPAPGKPNTPKLLDSQIRLIFARGRNAGLVVGEDAEPLMEFLEQSFSIVRVVSDGKKSAELAHAMLKTFPPSKMNELVRKLDELAKAPKGDAVETI